MSRRYLILIGCLLVMAGQCAPAVASRPPAAPARTPPAASPSFVAPTPTPSHVTVPSRVLDLRNWMLTLPEAVPGSTVAAEIKQPQLGSYSGRNFAVHAAGDGVVFTAPVGGATTEGSTYPRSELREMTSGGTEKASWSTDQGVNTMVVTEAVTRLPPHKAQVVTAQIHDASSDVIEILADGQHATQQGGIRLAVRYDGRQQPVHLDDAYLPGARYTVTLTAANGQISVAYNGVTKLVFTTSRSGLYFKAGAYTQSNPAQGDAPTSFGQVVIYALQVAHTG
jgi:hypothetical protein